MTAHSADVIGEIGVLCYMPQPFTVRSRKLSQLLRLDRIVFMNIVKSFKEDGQRIVDNLLQVPEQSELSLLSDSFFDCVSENVTKCSWIAQSN